MSSMCAGAGRTTCSDQPDFAVFCSCRVGAHMCDTATTEDTSQPYSKQHVMQSAKDTVCMKQEVCCD